MKRCRLLVPLLGLTSCAPVLSGFQPAHVAPARHWQAEVGMDISIPVGTIGAVVDAGEALVEAARERELMQEEKLKIFDAGLALALNPPSLVQHLGVAYTPLPRLEASLRLSRGAWRFGARYQILRQDAYGVDMSAGIGVGRYTYEFPVGDVLKILRLEDFKRWQVDVPLLVGKAGSWYRWWLGPRYIYTSFGTRLVLELPEIPSLGLPGETVLAEAKGSGHYVGGQGGLALGYRWVFLAVELTLVQLFTSGSLDAFGERALDARLDSFIIYPAVGLVIEI